MWQRKEASAALALLRASRVPAAAPRCLELRRSLVTGSASRSMASLAARSLPRSLQANAIRQRRAAVYTGAQDKGVSTPQIPGDVSLCSSVAAGSAAEVAAAYKGWLFLGASSSAELPRQALEKAGCRLEVVEVPADGLPSDAHVKAALAALDQLPKPLMVQGGAGLPDAMLLLWMAQRTGYSKESAQLIGTDMKLPLMSEENVQSAVREWMVGRLPAHDALPATTSSNGLVFQQLHDGDGTSTQTYIVGCNESKEALLIDPVLEHKDRDLAALAKLGLKLKYVVNTHCHADHVTSGGLIRKEMPHVKTAIAEASGAKADIKVKQGDSLKFGKFSLDAVATPGHTDGCITWQLVGDRPMLFTGDTLLIRGCGRTDFQAGDSGMLYDNVHHKIFSYPPETLLYPGHDYKQRNVSTVAEERLFNPRLTKSKPEFCQLMADLNLPYPARIDTALPLNLVCGVQD